jgi:rhodanese-related sulfurtransferase
MPTSINRAQLQRVLSKGAPLVEVLPEVEYLEEHLPGAINLPLRQLSAATVKRLDPNRSIVVYRWDAL